MGLGDAMMGKKSSRLKMKADFTNIAVRGKAPKVRKTTDGGVFRLRLTEGKNPRGMIA